MVDARVPDHSNVAVFPPLIPIAGALLGVALEKLVPLAPRLDPRVLHVAARVGAGLLAAGVAGFAWMVVTMKRARTPIHNARTPTTLVVTGPFRVTRNPMYLFGAVGYAGLMMLLAQPWALALLPLVQLLLDVLVVRREERYLERKFGDAYRAYAARVRRWI